MVQALRMPMMGNTMETGLLAEWVVAEGDSVETDQVLAVVESEKAAADVVANQAGTLARVDVAEGEEVPPGTLVGVVLGPDEDIADAPPPRSRIEPGGSGAPDAAPAGGTGDGAEGTADPGDSAPEPSGPTTAGSDGDRRGRAAPGARHLADEEGIDLGAVEGTGPDGAVLIADVEAKLEEARAGGGGEAATPSGRAPTAGRPFLPPSARRLARELGVDPQAVEGTGAGGRVTESDIRRAAGVAAPGTDEGRPRSASGGRVRSSDIAGPSPRDPSRYGVTVAEERELAGVRRTVAERMARSAREAPQVTLNREVAVGRAFETVEDLADAGRADVGFVDLLVGAAVRALEAHPEFNAWYEGESLRLIEEVNVAVAVDAESGLLAPVVRGADRRSLAGIAGERRRLTDAVLAGRHDLDDLQGGTFTVSNLGPLGVDSFDPILDPPQVAILGVGRVEEDACTLSLTFDHRVVDGADAARFLDTLAGGLEAPSAVVAERATAGAGAAGDAGIEPDPTAEPTGRGQSAGTEPPEAPESSEGAVEAAVASDLQARAREVAAAHDWPVPSFEVRLGGDRPTVTVEADGAGSPATLRRLAYAACRESRYADTVAGLRDPALELLTPRTDERD